MSSWKQAATIPGFTRGEVGKISGIRMLQPLATMLYDLALFSTMAKRFIVIASMFSFKLCEDWMQLLVQQVLGRRLERVRGSDSKTLEVPR